mgnify:CR=1 FL=1
MKDSAFLILAATTMLATPGFSAEDNARDTLLTVATKGKARGPDSEARFDLKMLEALGKTEFTTTTIWTEGAIRFTGVRLGRMMDALGIDKGTLELVALNDYMVEIDVADALNDAALIAYKMNGAPMSPRNKGPLWLVYPFDLELKYQSETYYSRSIWQMNRIVVLPPDE